MSKISIEIPTGTTLEEIRVRKKISEIFMRFGMRLIPQNKSIMLI